MENLNTMFNLLFLAYAEYNIKRRKKIINNVVRFNVIKVSVIKIGEDGCFYYLFLCSGH